MKTKAVRWITATAVAFCAWSVASAAPFEGVITGTDVNVRSGPGGPGAYPCAQLSTPARVTVVDKLDDWFKILPPTGCYSVVSKTYVKPDATGKTGTVTGNNVWVRAAGVLRGDNFFTLQARLNTNDKIAILGESGEFYQIKPPKGAYFWISSQFVKPVGATTPAATAGSGSGTASGGAGGTVSVAVIPTPDPNAARAVVTPPSTQPAPTASEVKIPAGMERFAAAEKLLLAEFKKPMDRRNYDTLLATYGAVNVTGDNAYLKPYVDARTALVTTEIQRRKDLADVTKLVGDAQRREQELKLAQAKLQSESPTARPIMSFAAQGILLASDLFPGTPAAPKRYIVRDRSTYFINAYVQCVTGSVNLEASAGKYVGIIGSTKFDKNLGLDVVEASDIRVLGENITVPMPPKPGIKPIPTPAAPPKPTVRPIKPAIPAGTTPGPTPLVKPKPKAEVKPAPVVTPTPTPKVEVKPVPVVTPTPKVEVEVKPVVTPTPKVEIEVKPAPIVTPTPKIEVKPEPIVTPTPKIEVKPEPVVTPLPKVEVKPAPIVTPTPKVEVEVKPAPIVTPTPNIEVKPGTPVVRFGPTTRPATTQPTTRATTRPATIRVLPRKIKSGAEEEYD